MVMAIPVLPHGRFQERADLCIGSTRAVKMHCRRPAFHPDCRHTYVGADQHGIGRPRLSAFHGINLDQKTGTSALTADDSIYHKMGKEAI
jgi:hypothetical protein